MKTQKPQLSRACWEAIAAKKPWAPRYGISHAEYHKLAGLESAETATPSPLAKEKAVERLRQRLVIVPYKPDDPHIFCESHSTLKRTFYCAGVKCHPLAALMFLLDTVDMPVPILKLWGTHAAVDDKTLDLYVPVRFRGKSRSHRNFDKLEKKRVDLYIPLWENECGEQHCINPNHLKGKVVKLSLLGRALGEPVENLETGYVNLRPIIDNPLHYQSEPPKFNKPRHVFEPRVMPQADLNMPTEKFKDLVKPLPKFYDKNGFDEDGFDREGYDAQGYDLAGCDRNGDAAPTPPELVPRVERRDTQDGFEIDLVVTTGKASLLAAYAKENGFTADFNANSFTLRSPNKDVANFNFILGGILQRGAFYPLVEVQP